MVASDPERSGPARVLAASLLDSLWPLPVLAIVLGVGLGVGLPAVDHWLQSAHGQTLALGFGGGPSAARSVLNAVATSLISVTALVFSLTVVALQLSSSQYTPRLLQTFVADRRVQLTLAQLVLTFVYALTVLRAVRSRNEAVGTDAFVPGTAITLAYLLTLGSVLAVVLFLGYLARALRVETMLREVHDEARAALGTTDDEDDEDDGAALPPAERACLLEAPSSGFLVGIDEGALVRAAADAGLLVRLLPRIGDGVVEGTPVAYAWPIDGAAGQGVDRDALGRALRRGLVLRYERQSSRDAPYSLRKIVDIAVRALSPGVNDPTTAVHALSHASALLGDLVARERGPRCHRDDGGQVRLVVPERAASALLRLTLEEPLQFASGQPAVLRRIARLLREVAWRAHRGSLDAEIRRFADRLVEVARTSTGLRDEEPARWRAEVEAALRGEWPTNSD